MTQHGAGDGRGGHGGHDLSRPAVLVFDVNETLSDMAPMAERFAEVGAPGHLASTWFASVLRDGFALTVTGENPSFADLARQGLRASLGAAGRDDSVVEHVMAGFTSLSVHPDVVEGVTMLRELGISLVTLSNGSSSVAEGLLERSGLAGSFDRLLSVEEAPLWKPAEAAYAFALASCGRQGRDAMLVASHPWDINGAHRAGLRTAWVNRTGVEYPTSFAEPELEASSLVDLAAQLGGVAA